MCFAVGYNFQVNHKGQAGVVKSQRTHWYLYCSNPMYFMKYNRWLYLLSICRYWDLRPHRYNGSIIHFKIHRTELGSRCMFLCNQQILNFHFNSKLSAHWLYLRLKQPIVIMPFAREAKRPKNVESGDHRLFAPFLIPIKLQKQFRHSAIRLVDPRNCPNVFLLQKVPRYINIIMR